MNKLELFNKLKAEGKIPEGLTVDSVTEQYLLSLDLKPEQAAGGTQTQLTMEEMKELVYSEFDKKVKETGIDKLDLKYAKLPNGDIPENELKNLTPKQVARKKMLNFVRHLAASGSSYRIFPESNQALESKAFPDHASYQPEFALALNSEGSSSVGGYAVPVEFIAEVSRLLPLYGAFRRNARYRTFGSLTASFPKISAQPSGAYRSNDTSAYSESNMTFGQVLFTAKDYGFISGLSRNLLQDAGVDLISVLSELVANDFALNEDTQGFLGTGSPITGVAASITDSAYIETTATTAASSLTLVNLINLITKPKSAALARDPKWYFHKSILGLILNLVDDNHRPIFTEQDKLGILSSKMFMNYPYELSDALNISQTSASKPIVMFGDLFQCATFGEREGLDIAVSDVATVGSNSAFEKKLVFYAFDTRHDIEIEQATAMAKIVTAAA